MGSFANPSWLKWLAWSTAVVIVLLNAKLLADFAGLTPASLQ
jgi:manganese transport protein